MDLILPYINPRKFAEALIENYGFEKHDAWNSEWLVMPETKGTGSLQLFIRNHIHFFRGKWNFNDSTIFYSPDPVGKMGFVDFRIEANGLIQSCALQGKKRFEFDTTHVDGLRMFIPESFLPVDKKTMHQRFEQSSFNHHITNLMNEVFAIDTNEVSNSILLESKVLEFIFYWREFLCNKQAQQNAHEMSDYQLQCVKTIKEILDSNLAQHISLKVLSRKAGLNEFDLKRCFKIVMGMPIKQYVIKARMQKARLALNQGHLPLNEICHITGYENRSHFIALYIKFFGVHPEHDYQNQ